MLAWLLPALAVAAAQAETALPESVRFFHSGDGWIDLFGEKNGESFTGKYRSAGAKYDRSAIEAICRIFDAPYDSTHSALSLRLIEFLDFLEDRLSPGARITVSSGYRSPAYNIMLRNRGGLAAKASLHQYGMAADLKMTGVSAKHIWDYVKGLGFGGAGYYHGETVHVDVGPARSWDEKTSGVGTDISSNNKLIGLVTDYDIYLPGELIDLRFIRMTAFPIGVSTEFFLERQTNPDGSDAVVMFRPALYIKAQGPCPQFNEIEQMAVTRWRLPKKLPPGRYRIRARFCDRVWDSMPEHVLTPEFRIVRFEEKPRS